MSTFYLRFPLAFVACVAVLAAPSSALGAAQRTFVKSTGVDNPACNLVAPCRSFAAAMLQTLPGGEVIVLDSAGYGAVTIAQSVSIIAPPGVYAGITASSGDGVTVNGAGIVVVLQGLTVNGLGTGNIGINFSAGDELHVINSSISNFALYGIRATSPGGRLFVSDTTIRGNGSGVEISAAPGEIAAVFERVHVEGSTAVGVIWAGIFAGGGVAMSVRGSVVSNNGGHGVYSRGPVRITVDDTLIADNANSGARVEGLSGDVATLDVIRSTLTRNKNYGAMAYIFPPCAPCLSSAVMTVVSSVVTENGFSGIVSTAPDGGNSTAFVSDNTIAGNVGGGIKQLPVGVVHTRSNNAGEQTVPTSGTVTAVPGF